MRRLWFAVAAVAAVIFVSSQLLAQPEEGPPGKKEKAKAEDCRGRPPFKGKGRGPRFGEPKGKRPPFAGKEARKGPPPPPPLIKALDKNRDGVISDEEIQNAAKALKLLDKNKDGKLSGKEIHPPPPFDGPGFGPPHGKRRFGPPGKGRFGPPHGKRRFGPPGKGKGGPPDRPPFGPKGKKGRPTRPPLEEGRRNQFPVEVEETVDSDPLGLAAKENETPSQW